MVTGIMLYHPCTLKHGSCGRILCYCGNVVGFFSGCVIVVGNHFLAVGVSGAGLHRGKWKPRRVGGGGRGGEGCHAAVANVIECGKKAWMFSFEFYMGLTFWPYLFVVFEERICRSGGNDLQMVVGDLQVVRLTAEGEDSNVVYI